MRYKDKVAIIGGGFLGNTLYRLLSKVYDVRLLSEHSDFKTHKIDYSSELSNELIDFLSTSKLVLVSIGSGNMDWVENHPEEAKKQHIQNLISILNQIGLKSKKIVYFSSDNVFSGNCSTQKLSKQFSVKDKPNPSSVYGKLKYDAEKIVLTYPNVLILRVPLLVSFSASDRNPLYKIYSELTRQNNKEIHIDDNQLRYPTFIEDIIDFIFEYKGTERLVHFSSDKEYTRFELYKYMNDILGTSNIILNDGVYPMLIEGQKSSERTQIKLVNNVNFQHRNIYDIQLNSLKYFYKV